MKKVVGKVSGGEAANEKSERKESGRERDDGGRKRDLERDRESR